MQVRGASSRLLKRLRTIASLQILLRDTEGVAGEIGVICTIGIENEMKFVVLKSLKGPDHQQLMLRKSFPDTDFEGIRKLARHQDLRSDMHASPYRRRSNDLL